MTTFYLKYRPQKIAELDLLDVRKQLFDIIVSGKIPHAFLFSGPRGMGKTSAARILAKAVNCEQKTEERKNKGAGEIEPCDECTQCTSIINGSNLDVIEIDAASNRGIDDVRVLREAVGLASVGGKKKVYIIDEAHMLTGEASNALLKTLEEPPSHVLFVLATTQPEKLPDTIRSRCVSVVFRKAGVGEIVGSLKKVVGGEGLKVEDEVLEEIASRVDGSFREAHKILEQLSFSGKKIGLEGVRGIFSFGSSDPERLVVLLSEGKIADALEEVSNVANGGASLKVYVTGLVSFLRKILLSEFGGEKVSLLASQLGGVGRVRKGIKLFSQAALEVGTAVIPQLPVELAIVEWVIGKENSQLSGPLHGSVATEGDTVSEVRGSDESVSKMDLEESWVKVMQIVKGKNHSVEALLRATRPQKFDGRDLVLEVFYQFHKERIEKDPFRSIVEKVAREVFGVEVRLTCLLATQKRRAIDVANVSEAVEEDIVKVAEEIFGGQEEDAGKLAN